jgi:hypothetical protein
MLAHASQVVGAKKANGNKRNKKNETVVKINDQNNKQQQQHKKRHQTRRMKTQFHNLLKKNRTRIE